MDIETRASMMERLIREVVAPLDLSTPRLPPQERRQWWEFCLWMHEFFSNLMQDDKVNRESGHHLARLRWVLLKGTYVFATADPALRGEQRRYVELCGCVATAFAIIVDDPEGFRDLAALAFVMDQSKEPAEAEALVGENWLRWWKTWEHAGAPLTWVREVAKRIHDRDHRPLSMDEEPGMRSLDSLTPTDDSYASLLPDLQALESEEIHATVDLDMACQREGLTLETSRLLRGCYNGVPLSVAPDVLGLSQEELAAARRELKTARPALEARLAPYREKRNPWQCR